MAEVFKILASICGQVVLEGGSIAAAFATFREETVGKPREMLKMAIPAGLYTIQNLLSYVATSALDGPTYQVLCQSKIFFTALLSVTVLGKAISGRQWRALLLLAAGVGVVQTAGGSATGGGGGGGVVSLAHATRPLLGCLSALLLCLCSGLAGVYFELVVKATATSLWVRNVQLSLFGVAIALCTMWTTEGARVAARGFFGGYTRLVWACIALHSLGGLAVALVIKYTDNLVKCFATSISIVLSCAITAAMANTPVSNRFAAAAAMVLGATVLYYKPRKKADAAAASNALLGLGENGDEKDNALLLDMSTKRRRIPQGPASPTSPLV